MSNVQIEKLCTKQILNINRCNNNKHTRTRAKITHAHVKCCILQQCSKTEVSVKRNLQILNKIHFVCKIFAYVKKK